MSDLPGLDLATLLAPLAGEAPAGPDLREDYTAQAVYYRLRDARAEARAAERQMDADGETAGPPPQQWAVIRQLAPAALAERSKDLEVAAWYTEALLRSDGLAGLAAGCRLMAGLVEGFWDTLYPRPDEDGMATRVAPVTGLNGEGADGTLIQPIRKLTLFARPDGEPVPLWKYQQSAEVEAIGDKARRQQRLASGVIPFEKMQVEARAAGGAHFAALRNGVRAAAAGWQALGEALDARAGADSPSISRVRDLLEQVAAIAAQYAPAESAAAAEEAAAGIAEGGAAEAVAGVPVPGKLATREDALRALIDIAEFFRRTEPHSPLAYTLDEAVRRGRLSWPELLDELVPEQGARSAILTALGIKPPG